MHHYFIFGLNIASSIPLPAQSANDTSDSPIPDVRIEYGNTPAALADPQSKGLRFEASPGEFLLRVDDVARYYVCGGNRIVIEPEPGAAEERILIFLMGSAFGALLHQHNILVLHAGAVAINGRSVIFAGQSGAGKSTLAAGFHKRGYPFLADDVCAIAINDGIPAVIPGFPRLKLWADVLKHLHTDKTRLQSVRWTQGLEKYYLPMEQGYEQPVPLSSVFILRSTNKSDINIETLQGNDKIDPLLANTYRMRFLNGLGGKKEHFRQCSAVAAKTGVHKVERPQKGFMLDDLMDRLEEHFL